MEKIGCLHDCGRIGRFLRGSPNLHLFLLADLDPARWRQFSWYGLETRGRIKAVAALLGWKAPPFLVLLSARRDTHFASRLLREIRDVLPARFDADLTVGLNEALRERFSAVSPGS